MSKPGSAVPQRIMALFLSLAMALSLLVAGPRRVQEGMMPASLASSLGEVTLSSVRGSLIWGLGEPSDLTATDAVASVFSTTGALTAGKPRAQAEKSIALVQELAAELDTLCHYTLDSSDDIKNMIKCLKEMDAKESFYVNAGTPVDDFATQYANTGKDFNDLVNAYVTYGDDPSEQNRSTPESRYTRSSAPTSRAGTTPR